jgi:hypothetical protein
LVRSSSVHADPLAGASFLNRSAASVWGSEPIFVQLGDDLAAGDHLISLRLEGTTQRGFARFFSYGGSGGHQARISVVGESSRGGP